MKHILTALFLALAAPVAAQDGFDFAQAQIVNAPDVRNWPARATITGLSFDGSTTRVAFTKYDGPDRWPDIIPAGWTGPLQYTLWLCLQNGTWTCSAFIQFWHGRDGSGSPSDPDVPSLYDKHWYYAERWAPLFGHGPIRPGEPIGFLVTSGNARDNVGPLSVQERSNVVVVPATDRGSFTFGAPSPPPVPAPPPPPGPTPMPPPVPVFDASALAAQIAALKADVDAGRAESQTFYDESRAQWKHVAEFVAKYGSIVAGALFAGHQLAK